MESTVYWTIDEIAKLLSVSRETIAKDVRKGVIPSIKIGRQYRITHKDLIDYIQAKQVEKGV